MKKRRDTKRNVPINTGIRKWVYNLIGEPCNDSYKRCLWCTFVYAVPYGGMKMN